MTYLDFIRQSRGYLVSVGAAIAVAEHEGDQITMWRLNDIEQAIHNALVGMVQEAKDHIKKAVRRYTGKLDLSIYVDPDLRDIRLQNDEIVYQPSDVDNEFDYSRDNKFSAYSVITSVYMSAYLADPDDQDCINNLVERYIKEFYGY